MSATKKPSAAVVSYLRAAKRCSYGTGTFSLDTGSPGPGGYRAHKTARKMGLIEMVKHAEHVDGFLRSFSIYKLTAAGLEAISR